MKPTSTSHRVTAQSSRKPVAHSAQVHAEVPQRGSSPRRWKIESLLVPVDFSTASEAAYEFALELAEQYNGRVYLLHVIEHATSPDFENFPLVRDRHQLVAKVENELVGFARTGSHPVVPVFPEVRTGSPWEEIVDAARAKKVDLIVIPTHGYTGIKHLLLGSVAEKVLRHAPCPVLALRDKNIDFLSVHGTADPNVAEVSI